MDVNSLLIGMIVGLLIAYFIPQFTRSQSSAAAHKSSASIAPATSPISSFNSPKTPNNSVNLSPSANNNNTSTSSFNTVLPSINVGDVSSLTGNHRFSAVAADKLKQLFQLVESGPSEGFKVFKEVEGFELSKKEVAGFDVPIV